MLSEAYPDLFLSSQAGKTPWRYVQEQMNSRTTRRKVWNLRMPNMVGAVFSWSSRRGRLSGVYSARVVNVAAVSTEHVSGSRAARTFDTPHVEAGCTSQSTTTCKDYYIHPSTSASTSPSRLTQKTANAHCDPIQSKLSLHP